MGSLGGLGFPLLLTFFFGLATVTLGGSGTLGALLPDFLKTGFESHPWEIFQIGEQTLTYPRSRIPQGICRDVLKTSKWVQTGDCLDGRAVFT